MILTAKLFINGHSQAIRLPAKLRFNAQKVRIEQIGQALWVQPEPSPDQNMADWLKSFYAATEALPDTFLANRDDSPSQHML